MCNRAVPQGAGSHYNFDATEMKGDDVVLCCLGRVTVAPDDQNRGIPTESTLTSPAAVGESVLHLPRAAYRAHAAALSKRIRISSWNTSPILRASASRAQRLKPTDSYNRIAGMLFASTRSRSDLIAGPISAIAALSSWRAKPFSRTLGFTYIPQIDPMCWVF